jgi:hypothetical protein
MLYDYFFNDPNFAIDFIKNLSISLQAFNIMFDFSNVILENKNIVNEISLDTILKINDKKKYKDVIKTYINYSDSINLDTIKKYIDLTNDEEIVKLIIDKDPNNIIKIDSNNIGFYKYAAIKGYILSINDIKKLPELLNENIFLYSLNKNSSLATLINSEEVLIKVINSKYNFTYEDLKNNPFLRKEIIINNILSNDLRCIEFSNYNKETYELAINQLITKLNHSYYDYKYVFDKVKNNEELTHNDEKIINLLKSSFSSFDNEYNTILENLNNNYKYNLEVLYGAIATLNDNTPSDKFIIDRKYLMNSINKFISQYGNNIDVCSFINNMDIASINKFIKFDRFYSKSFGEEIESLYNSKEYVLGIHGSRDSFPKLLRKQMKC